MSETRVQAGTHFYNETTQPTIRDDGTMVLASGRTLPPGSWNITDDDACQR